MIFLSMEKDWILLVNFFKLFKHCYLISRKFFFRFFDNVPFAFEVPRKPKNNSCTWKRGRGCSEFHRMFRGLQVTNEPLCNHKQAWFRDVWSGKWIYSVVNMRCKPQNSIFREINFGESRSSKTAIYAILRSLECLI